MATLSLSRTELNALAEALEDYCPLPILSVREKVKKLKQKKEGASPASPSSCKHCGKPWGSCDCWATKKGV